MIENTEGRLNYYIIFVVLVFLLAVFILSARGSMLNRDYYGNPLRGECFVTIVQGGLGPKDLPVKSPMRMYAYAITENCQAVYDSCAGLYRGRNITCRLDQNICRCVEDGL